METNIDEIVRSLDDGNAERILTTSVRHHLGASGPETVLTEKFQEALRASFRVERRRDPVSNGDIAREALLILAQDLQARERIAVLTDSPPTQRFGIDQVTRRVLATAVITVLKTQVEYGGNETEGWSVHVKSNAVEEHLLKGFVEMLLSWIHSDQFGRADDEKS